MNLQPWRVVIVNTPERKTVLRQCAFNQPKVEEASATLIMVADPAGVEANRIVRSTAGSILGMSNPKLWKPIGA